MELNFKRVLLFSVLAVLLGFGLVYSLSLEYQPHDTTQTGSPTPGTSVSDTIYILVFAYFGDNLSSGQSGFVQASVSIADTQYNGTTTTDLQNPLTFKLHQLGVYTVIGTYGSFASKNLSISVTSYGSVLDAFLNFGSSSVPSLGHIRVEGWYTSRGPNNTLVSGQVRALVNISGPQQLNGTTGSGPQGELIFTVQPGEYYVQGAYGSAMQNQTISVTADHVSEVFLFFGDGSYAPPP